MSWLLRCFHKNINDNGSNVGNRSLNHSKLPLVDAPLLEQWQSPHSPILCVGLRGAAYRSDGRSALVPLWTNQAGPVWDASLVSYPSFVELLNVQLVEANSHHLQYISDSYRSGLQASYARRLPVIELQREADILSVPGCPLMGIMCLFGSPDHPQPAVLIVAKHTERPGQLGAPAQHMSHVQNWQSTHMGLEGLARQQQQSPVWSPANAIDSRASPQAIRTLAFVDDSYPSNPVPDALTGARARAHQVPVGGSSEAASRREAQPPGGRALDGLAASERQRDTMIAAHLPAIITIFGLDGSVVHQNPASARYMGEMPSISAPARPQRQASKKESLRGLLLPPRQHSLPLSNTAPTRGQSRRTSQQLLERSQCRTAEGGASLGAAGHGPGHLQASKSFTISARRRLVPPSAIMRVGAAASEGGALDGGSVPGVDMDGEPPPPSSMGVLALIFQHEPSKLEQLVQEMQEEGAVWQGIVRVPQPAVLREQLLNPHLRQRSQARLRSTVAPEAPLYGNAVSTPAPTVTAPTSASTRSVHSMRPSLELVGGRPVSQPPPVQVTQPVEPEQAQPQQLASPSRHTPARPQHSSLPPLVSPSAAKPEATARVTGISARAYSRPSSSHAEPVAEARVQMTSEILHVVTLPRPSDELVEGVGCEVSGPAARDHTRDSAHIVSHSSNFVFSGCNASPSASAAHADLGALLHTRTGFNDQAMATRTSHNTGQGHATGAAGKIGGSGVSGTRTSPGSTPEEHHDPLATSTWTMVATRPSFTGRTQSTAVLPGPTAASSSTAARVASATTASGRGAGRAADAAAGVGIAPVGVGLMRRLKRITQCTGILPQRSGRAEGRRTDEREGSNDGDGDSDDSSGLMEVLGFARRCGSATIPNALPSTQPPLRLWKSTASIPIEGERLRGPESAGRAGSVASRRVQGGMAYSPLGPRHGDGGGTGPASAHEASAVQYLDYGSGAEGSVPGPVSRVLHFASGLRFAPRLGPAAAAASGSGGQASPAGGAATGAASVAPASREDLRAGAIAGPPWLLSGMPVPGRIAAAMPTPSVGASGPHSPAPSFGVLAPGSQASTEGAALGGSGAHAFRSGRRSSLLQGPAWQGDRPSAAPSVAGPPSATKHPLFGALARGLRRQFMKHRRQQQEGEQGGGVDGYLPSLGAAAEVEEEGEEEEGDDCWHEVAAVCATDPLTGALVMVITQVDVTARVRAERHLVHVLCAERRLLLQLFPRHVLQHVVEDSPLLALTGGPGGPGGAPSTLDALPAEWLAAGDWRPVLRGADKLATMHPQATVLFADISGFDDLCMELAPQQVLAFLNHLFARFDAAIEPFGVHKMETIGGLFIVAGGLLREEEDGAVAVRERERGDPLHVEKVFMFAKAMLAVAARTPLPSATEPSTRGSGASSGGPSSRPGSSHPSGSGSVQLRIGIHSGPVMSGVVGTRVPRFVLFGDTVNTASRMQTTCTPGTIHVSEDTRALLPHEAWVPTGGVQIKGKGLLQTFVWSPEEELPYGLAQAAGCGGLPTHSSDTSIGTGGGGPPMATGRRTQPGLYGGGRGDRAGGWAGGLLSTQPHASDTHGGVLLTSMTSSDAQLARQLGFPPPCSRVQSRLRNEGGYLEGHL